MEIYDTFAVFDDITTAKLWHLTCQMLTDDQLIPKYDELYDSPPEGLISGAPFVKNGKIQYTNKVSRYSGQNKILSVDIGRIRVKIINKDGLIHISTNLLGSTYEYEQVLSSFESSQLKYIVSKK